MPADTSEQFDRTPHTRPLQLELLELGDTAAAWEAAGFRVSNGNTVQLGGTTIACTGTGEAFLGWRIEGLGGEDPHGPKREIDGINLLAPSDSTSPVFAQEAQPHPNGITRIDHIVVSTGNCDRSIAAFEAADFVVRGERCTSSYGSPMRQVFFFAGDVIVELMGPDRGQEVSDAPASIFGLALVAEDLSFTAEALGDLLGTPKDAVQAGRQIAGLRTKSVGIGLAVAVMSPHQRR